MLKGPASARSGVRARLAETGEGLSTVTAMNADLRDLREELSNRHLNTASIVICISMLSRVRRVPRVHRIDAALLSASVGR